MDIENRVWPRPQDPNRLAGAPTQKLLRDNFLVFPSLQPFARAGLAQPFANPANDTLYTYPNEYLYSQQRPQSIFRLQTRIRDGGIRHRSMRSNLARSKFGPLSERVLLDGQPLVRDVDYTANYELGVINFNRRGHLVPAAAAKLWCDSRKTRHSPPRRRRFSDWSSLLNLEKGQIGFTAISQRRRSTYNRPPLGLESAGSLMAGITANFGWNATALTSLRQQAAVRDAGRDVAHSHDWRIGHQQAATERGASVSRHVRRQCRTVHPAVRRMRGR